MSINETVLISGPSFQVQLPTLDACHPIHYSRRLLLFECSSAAQRQQQISALKVGLKNLLLRCPILGGTVVAVPPEEANQQKPGECRIVNGDGIELTVKDVLKDMLSFDQLESAGFPSAQLPYELLIPVPRVITLATPFAACKVQYSAIKGGAIIAWSMSHSVGDGSGNNEMLRVLSQEMSRAQVQPASSITDEVDVFGLDRNVLCDITSKLPFNFADHPGYSSWETISSIHKSPSLLSKPDSSSTTVILHIEPENLAKLKADAQLPAAPSISTHDALAAMIWRSCFLLRTRRAGISQEDIDSIVADQFMPSDARKHLNLPQSYIGNAVYQLKSQVSAHLLLGPDGLAHGASAIRRAITAINAEIVESYMAELRSRWLPWSFLGTMLTTGVAMGTDWTSGELYGFDWGDAYGPLVRFRYPDEPVNCVLPKLPDGSAEVAVALLPNEIEVLKSVECFGKYI